MNEMINPYIAGAPVTESRMFFGREDIFNWIERNLIGQYVDHILVLHGQRRIGKTSILKQLSNRLPERYIPVFFDLQGRTHTTLDRFLWWLAREIARVLKQKRGIVIPTINKDAFAQDPEYLESHFLPSVQSHLTEHVLLLTFDEFDTLEEPDAKKSLATPLIEYLKRLMGGEGLSFIYSIGSSGRKLENMQAAYTEFFKAALYKKVSFLDRRDTQRLITLPVEGQLEFRKEAIDRIFYVTSGHPYFTQLTCHELFSLSQKTDLRRIQRTHVDAILDDVIERGTVNLKFAWDEASDLEKWVLASLAQISDKVNFHKLSEFLHRQNVRFSEPDLNSALLHLREKDILTNDNRFVIELMRIWLVKNRPLDRVREELVEINPIANRYIEIGHEYKDLGLYEKAVDSFQEALTVDPQNLQAQTNIASVYLYQKKFTQAVAEFEKALGIDDEDVAARSGLCETRLALGDQSLTKNRTREAIKSYKKVLAINAEHTEARERMADIFRERAEKALVEGHDKEAIRLFEEALDYIPEDETLAKRFAEVREQKKAKLVAGLVAQADKAGASNDFDQEIAFIKEALNLAPDDSSLQIKLTKAKKQQRESHLNTLKDRARSLTKAEKWDQALSTWREYLAMNPEDSQLADDEIQLIEQTQKMAQAYSDAQAAIERKDYNEAIRLLKDIIIQDETYKDVSRLLAQVIDLRRSGKRFWRSRWLWIGTGSVSIVGMVFLLTRPSSFFMAMLSRLTGTPTITPMHSQSPNYPLFSVNVNTGRVDGEQWTLGTEVTMTIDDDNDPGNGVLYEDTQTVGYKYISYSRETMVVFQLPDVFDIQTGHIVTLTDGTTTKTHTVLNLEVTSVDAETDQVQGAADPGAEVLVSIFQHYELWATADDTGHWMVDFTGLYDLLPGTEGCAELRDADGDNTRYEWSIPSSRSTGTPTITPMTPVHTQSPIYPLFSVNVNTGRVDGEQWTLGTEVTMTIDDDNDPGNGVLYEDTQTVGYKYISYSRETMVVFQLPDVFDIQTGHIVTLTDGTTTKTHTVLNLEVTSVDAETDQVQGAADPGAEVLVSIFQHYELWATADDTGHWMVDFTGLYDLVPGTEFGAQVRDAERNSTIFEWTVHSSVSSTPVPPLSTTHLLPRQHPLWKG